MPQYYINEGVRRCVAAWQAGLVDILAKVFEPGKPPYTTRIPLDQLHSPKPVIWRDYRYTRYTEYPTLILKTEPPPIFIEPLGLPGQKATIPLLQVAVH